MRYISDDGKVFNTEQECLIHENAERKRLEEKRKLEMERENKLAVINKKYEELQKLISDYKMDYGIRTGSFSISYQELIKLLNKREI